MSCWFLATLCSVGVSADDGTIVGFPAVAVVHAAVLANAYCWPHRCCLRHSCMFADILSAGVLCVVGVPAVAFVTAGIPDVADISASAGVPAVIGSIAISSVPADPGCAAKAFCYCPAIISHRPRSQNILKERALNPEKDSRIKRPRSQVSLEKSSQNYLLLEN